jgi:hypothetical protein
MKKTSIATLTLALAALGLGGCASLNTVDSDVSTYATWPAQRKASTYAFERLPSQQARAQEADQLEAAARPSLQKAGFRETETAAQADTSVQVGVRVTRVDQRLYEDPFWWRGAYSSRYYRGPWGPWGPAWGPYWGPGWGPGASLYYDTPRFDREVVVVIRDRKSNQVLYEARAVNEGNSAGNPTLLAAMFEAAMQDFPNAGVNPRRVSVQLPQGNAAP